MSLHPSPSADLDDAKFMTGDEDLPGDRILVISEIGFDLLPEKNNYYLHIIPK